MSKLTSTVFNNLISEGLPWASELGVCAEHMGAGEARLRLPYQDSSLRPGGTISGPHMMLLADACMYAVVMSLIGEVALAVTTNLNINFVQKPSKTDLLAEGRIIKLGKRLAVIEVSIISAESGNLVAHATGTYSIPPKV
jgi:uncharacterized protein (TIGR00369 family)